MAEGTFIQLQLHTHSDPEMSAGDKKTRQWCLLSAQFTTTMFQLSRLHVCTRCWCLIWWIRKGKKNRSVPALNRDSRSVALSWGPRFTLYCRSEDILGKWGPVLKCVWSTNKRDFINVCLIKEKSNRSLNVTLLARIRTSRIVNNGNTPADLRWTLACNQVHSLLTFPLEEIHGPKFF